MKTIIRWTWHRFWKWEPLCYVRSSAWGGGRLSWNCSCGKSFHLHLWPKEKP